MLRILLSGLLITVLTACSTTGGRAPVAGYSPSDHGLTDRRAKKPVVRSVGKRDLAQPGSYHKAPRGAFALRDYSRTHLNQRSAMKLINSYRASKGLKPLKLSTKLAKAARAHARDLARNDRISHQGSDGSDPWDRVGKTGYKARLAAENVGTGQVTLGEVFKGWQDSPGHNANLLLADAKEMGIALIKEPKSEYKTFWVLALGSKL